MKGDLLARSQEWRGLFVRLEKRAIKIVNIACSFTFGFTGIGTGTGTGAEPKDAKF